MESKYLVNQYPYICYTSNDNKLLFSCVIVDPDATKEDDCKSHCVLHYFCGNFSGQCIDIVSRGLPGDHVMVPYIPPIPIKGTGVHRYIFLYYQQPPSMVQKFPEMNGHNDLDINKRRNFNLRKFEIDHQLKLVAANFFYCGHKDDIEMLKVRIKLFDDEYIETTKLSKLRQPDYDGEINLTNDKEYQEEIKQFKARMDSKEKMVARSEAIAKRDAENENRARTSRDAQSENIARTSRDSESRSSSSSSGSSLKMFEC